MIDQTPAEPIIEPELPIVDAQHHLWFLPEALPRGVEVHDSIHSHVLAPVLRRSQYLLDEFLADIKTGHNVRASVSVECHAMYPDGWA